MSKKLSSKDLEQRASCLHLYKKLRGCVINFGSLTIEFDHTTGSFVKHRVFKLSCLDAGDRIKNNHAFYMTNAIFVDHLNKALQESRDYLKAMADCEDIDEEQDNLSDNL